MLIRKRFQKIYEPRTYLVPPKSVSLSHTVDCSVLCIAFEVSTRETTKKRTDLDLATRHRVSPLPAGLLAWIPAVMKADATEIIAKNGLDAYVFVRFLFLMIEIFLPFTLSVHHVVLTECYPDSCATVLPLSYYSLSTQSALEELSLESIDLRSETSPPRKRTDTPLISSSSGSSPSTSSISSSENTAASLFSVKISSFPKRTLDSLSPRPSSSPESLRNTSPRRPFDDSATFFPAE